MSQPQPVIRGPPVRLPGTQKAPLCEGTVYAATTGDSGIGGVLKNVIPSNILDHGGPNIALCSDAQDVAALPQEARGGRRSSDWGFTINRDEEILSRQTPESVALLRRKLGDAERKRKEYLHEEARRRSHGTGKSSGSVQGRPARLDVHDNHPGAQRKFEPPGPTTNVGDHFKTEQKWQKALDDAKSKQRKQARKEVKMFFEATVSAACAAANPHSAVTILETDTFRKSVRTEDGMKLRVGNPERAVWASATCIAAGSNAPYSTALDITGIKGTFWNKHGSRHSIIIPGGQTCFQMWSAQQEVVLKHVNPVIGSALLTLYGASDIASLTQGIIYMPDPEDSEYCMVPVDTRIFQIIQKNAARMKLDMSSLEYTQLSGSGVRVVQVMRKYVNHVLQVINREVFQRVPYIGGKVRVAVSPGYANSWGDYRPLARKAGTSMTVLKRMVTQPVTVWAIFSLRVIHCGDMNLHAGQRLPKWIGKSYDARTYHGMRLTDKEWKAEDDMRTVHGPTHSESLDQEVRVAHENLRPRAVRYEAPGSGTEESFNFYGP